MDASLSQFDSNVVGMLRYPHHTTTEGRTMSDFRYTVTVDAATQDEADTVMAERLAHDEDYGFDYTVGWEHLDSGPDERSTT